MVVENLCDGSQWMSSVKQLFNIWIMSIYTEHNKHREEK